MNSNSPLGAIPALIGNILASRRAKAANSVQPALVVRVFEEVLLVVLIGGLIAMVGFGLPGAIGDKIVAVSLLMRFALVSLRISRLLPERFIGTAPTLMVWLLTGASTLIVVIAAFINSDAYGLLFALSALFVARLLWRLLPLVHRTMMERYAGHVARMEAENARKR